MKLLKPEEIPKLIRIGEVEYHICFAPKLKGKLDGFCDFEMKLIALALDQDLESLNASLWHELCHAIEHEYKIKLGHPIIEKLEWAILQITRQLP